MIGQPAPGEDLGGWYRYDPNYDWHTFRSWLCAVGDIWTVGFGAGARVMPSPGSQATREKVLRLNRLYAKTIDGEFYENNSFPCLLLRQAGLRADRLASSMRRS